MPLKQNNRIRAYRTRQAVQRTGSTAIIWFDALLLEAGEQELVQISHLLLPQLTSILIDLPSSGWK
jgi:hypothetical protein